MIGKSVKQYIWNVWKPEEDVHFEVLEPGQPPRSAVGEGEGEADVHIAERGVMPVDVGFATGDVVAALVGPTEIVVVALGS